MSRILNEMERRGIRRPSNVFISGTYDDLAEIRKKVRFAIDEAGESGMEPHYRVGSLEDLRIPLSLQIQHEADMYIGIFGTRYGTRVSSDEDAKSYSHFEFLEALTKWNALRPPPIAVFEAVFGSELYLKIDKKCEDALKDKYGADEASIAEDKRLQRAFIEFIRLDPKRGNRMLNPVSEEEELYRKVGNWVTRCKLGAAIGMIERDARGPMRIETDSQRWTTQHEEVQKICNNISRNEQQINIPGVCILIRGARGKGQAELASQLAQPGYWENEADPVCWEIEKIDPLNGSKVWNTLWNAAEIYPLGSFDDTDNLAKEILGTEETLIVVLRQIQKLEGRLRGFAERFWQPVYDSLLKASQGHSPGNQKARLAVIVTYEGGDFELDESICREADSLPDVVDFRKIIRLTKLS